MGFKVGEWGGMVGSVLLAEFGLVVFGCLNISLQLWQHICIPSHGCDREEKELASFGAGKRH